jgi:hypothetical protein
MKGSEMKKAFFAAAVSLAAVAGLMAPVARADGMTSEQEQLANYFREKPTMFVAAALGREMRGACEVGGGHWVQSEGKLAWACRNSAGRFGNDGLPPGSPATPGLMIVISDTSKTSMQAQMIFGGSVITLHARSESLQDFNSRNAQNGNGNSK